MQNIPLTTQYYSTQRFFSLAGSYNKHSFKKVKILKKASLKKHLQINKLKILRIYIQFSLES